MVMQRVGQAVRGLRDRRPGQGRGDDRGLLQQPRRVSRREREVRQRRILLAAMAAVMASVLLLLVGGALYDYVIVPRQALATVNGTTIRREDYWKQRRFSLISQIQQYQYFAAQNPQYASYVQQLQRELPQVRQAPVDSQTLTSMIDDTVTLQRLDTLGLSVTDADVQAYIGENFAPVPINSPTPSPTINPTAAAWATATASAQAAATTPSATPGTPAAGTPGAGTPGAAETPGTPTGSATPATAPVLGTSGTPATTRTPGASPEASATPNRDEALATATATYNEYLRNLRQPSGMSPDDYVRLVARPAVARQKVTERLQGEIRDVQPQVRAAHILVATRDGAEAARTAVTTGGRDFGEVAREQSTDTSTAPNGGDLGWFPRGVMVEPFEQAAFALQPVEVSQPVQTKFGWHVIKVLERDEARPLTAETLSSLKEGAFQKWLDGQKASSQITSQAEATPTPAAQQFEAPPGAPPPPTPTPPPLPSPAPTPPAPAAPSPTTGP